MNKLKISNLKKMNDITFHRKRNKFFIYPSKKPINNGKGEEK